MGNPPPRKTVEKPREETSANRGAHKRVALKIVDDSGIESTKIVSTP